ncbi:RlmE family RNA methyltransferase [Labrys sp. ZIDIC5]|uniref:RlmE family RNA methyltransferase n=1 Tax=Labrys sedimenti TaxID=3106036 RepID=UPI002ACAF607|nr:RlmE family RNA methyltransferase [Labrys sp. ZIDIC5]MDZ5448450.1 RlmE family RNA methyltransferase [Labrys sp. ZIDIC5]
MSGGAGKGGGPGKGKNNSGRGSGARELGVRLKTARGRTHSSQLWLERQLNDPYVARAKREGRRSRAIYKLIEINDKAKLLKPGQRVLDLGAAPGGWSQLAAEITDSVNGRGKVVAIDLLPIDPIPGVDFEQMDFMDDAAPDRLKTMLGGPADLVLSDMAANTVGHRATDHLRIIALVEAAAYFAVEVLAPGGAFLAKVFQGGTEGDVLTLLKRDFAVVKHLKPAASRAGSSEMYVLATGFRGRKETDSVD